RTTCVWKPRASMNGRASVRATHGGKFCGGFTTRAAQLHAAAPGETVLAVPAPHHRDLVGMGLAGGEAAHLHDQAVAAHLDGDALVEVAERVFAGQRPDRDLAAHAQCLIARYAVMHALALAVEVVAGVDLSEAPDRGLRLAAGLVVDIAKRPARPAAAADRLRLGERPMPLLHAAAKRRKRAALERKVFVLLPGGDDEVDEI